MRKFSLLAIALSAVFGMTGSARGQNPETQAAANVYGLQGVVHTVADLERSAALSRCAGTGSHRDTKGISCGAGRSAGGGYAGSEGEARDREVPGRFLRSGARRVSGSQTDAGTIGRPYAGQCQSEPSRSRYRCHDGRGDQGRSYRAYTRRQTSAANGPRRRFESVDFYGGPGWV